MENLIYSKRAIKTLSQSANITRSYPDLFLPYEIPFFIEQDKRRKLEFYYKYLNASLVVNTEKDLLFLFLHDLKRYEFGRSLSFMNCCFSEHELRGKQLGLMQGNAIVNVNHPQGYPCTEELLKLDDYKEEFIKAGVIPVVDATPETLRQELSRVEEYRKFLDCHELFVVFNGSSKTEDLRGTGEIIRDYYSRRENIAFQAVDKANKDMVLLAIAGTIID